MRRVSTRTTKHPLSDIYLHTKNAIPTHVVRNGVLYYFQIQLRHLLAPFSFWRPLTPFSVALLRCISFPLARTKNSPRILAHFHLEIVLLFG